MVSDKEKETATVEQDFREKDKRGSFEFTEKSVTSLRGQEKDIIFKADLKLNRFTEAAKFYYKANSEDDINTLKKKRSEARRYAIYLNQKGKAVEKYIETDESVGFRQKLFDDVYKTREESAVRRAEFIKSKADKELDLTKTRVDASIYATKVKASKGLYAKRGAEYKKFVKAAAKEEKQKALTKGDADVFWGAIDFKAPSGTASSTSSPRPPPPFPVLQSETQRVVCEDEFLEDDEEEMAADGQPRLGADGGVHLTPSTSVTSGQVPRLSLGSVKRHIEDDDDDEICGSPAAAAAAAAVEVPKTEPPKKKGRSKSRVQPA
eukprot:TRINITY_DN22364_c0_g1_i1.p1 TRINITY_DN22364_c0_g1~~TRINITY_DN22364_c0_g1_i1.p1  ORF type:complete len:334 (+),score=89.04 TRINITY_DN22364_c0_g1_i1:41-1003(+)